MVACDLAAYAGVRLPVESLAEIRKQPAQVLGEPLPSSVLKHADEQTVAAIAAVYQAIREHGLPVTGYHAWGVLAAPRFLGRATLAGALQKFNATSNATEKTIHANLSNCREPRILRSSCLGY